MLVVYHISYILHILFILRAVKYMNSVHVYSYGS